MKIKYIVLCVLLALVGCQRDEEMEITQLTISNEQIEPSYTSVAISCNITANITIKSAMVYVSESQDFSGAHSYLLAKKNNTFTAEIDGLADGTTYYVCYQISNRWSSLMTEETSTFQTKTDTIPTVSTQVIEVSYVSAIVGGNVTDDGGLEVTERGVVYSTNQNPTTADSKITNGSGLGEFMCNLTNLQYETTYYVRAYAVNAKGMAYGNEVSFTTIAKTVATIITKSATNVSYTSAAVGGNVTDNGGLEVTERGVVYSTNQNPTTADSKITNGSGLGEFTCNLTDLQDGMTYYVRAYAINAKGTSYGEEVSFTTKAKTIATIITKSATNVSYTSAAVGGNVTDNGGLEVTERGVVYSTNQNPTTANNKVTNGSGLGSFTCNLTDLKDGTIYYVRAYAINEKGIAYGEEVSFTTTSLKEGEVIENGYVYVDLGLSVKWASHNIGATKPEDYGDYFAWGEVEPKEVYSWSTYKWCYGSEISLSKYCTESTYGTVDNKTILELIDDAAHVNWGGSWRMPTDTEMIELRNNCTWTWTTQNGVNGYKVTSKSNGNSIFLPAAGWRFDSSLEDAGIFGNYWSSSLNYVQSDACILNFNSDYVEAGNSSIYRYWGLSVRPVCP